MKVIPFGRDTRRNVNVHHPAHPEQDDFDGYVTDTLSADESDRLEAHVSQCPPCAERLAQAARFEVMLFQAAAEPAAAVAGPSLAQRWRRRFGTAGGAWAAAAAIALMMLGPSQADTTDPSPTAAAVRVDRSAWIQDPWTNGCEPGDPACMGELFASIDPLETIDPLSSWPDDPLVRSGFAETDFLDGEPCGSGEDGGPLVCPSSNAPFSG